MLSALARKFGSVGAKDLIGVDSNTWKEWSKKRRKPTMAARKAVWLVWSLALHPEQVTSLWDIATYGRFHGQQIMEPPDPEYEI
jgi:arylsulfatase A-like enzyme